MLQLKHLSFEWTLISNIHDLTLVEPLKIQTNTFCLVFLFILYTLQLKFNGTLPEFTKVASDAGLKISQDTHK